MGFSADWLPILEQRGLVAPSAPAPPLDILEEPFQQMVLKLARGNGWLAYHTRDSRRSEPGYPDCAFAKLDPPFRYFMAEIKREGEEPTEKQWRWINAIRAAGVACYVWRPSDWEFVVRTLK